MNLKTAFLSLVALPSMAAALDISFPEGSELAYETSDPTGSYALPDAPYLDDFLSTRRVNGVVHRQVWSYSADASTEQLIDPLRQQIEQGGYAILLDCDADSCGGFDFRFSTDVVQAPDMFVDLEDFRFVSGLRESFDGSSAISVLVSRAGDKALTQVITVAPGEAEASLTLGAGITLSPVSTTQVVAQGSTILALQTGGRSVLRDLSFQTGSSELADLTFQSLRDLAGFLSEDPDRRIALVGHSDNVGSLENNMALSEKRAQSVETYLVEMLGVDASQLEAHGVGFLSPMASNANDAGKSTNRRVEAVLLNP